MKSKTTSIINKVTWWSILAILVLVPFQALLTIWLSSIFGHYTAIRLWEEYLLVIIAIGSIYTLVSDKKVQAKVLTRKLFYVLAVYLIMQLIWGVLSYHSHDVSRKALAYGLLLNCRYLLFFIAAWIAGLKTDLFSKNYTKIIIYPSAVVILVGILQIFILPHNFLSHFGYGPNTILPYETINHNAHYIRVMSTLRGANPLGAYLIIPLTLISTRFFRNKRSWQETLLFVLGLVVLFFSFSRSAWIGVVLAVVISFYYSTHTKRARQRLIYLAAVGLVVLAVLAFSFRNNVKVQNVLYHTQTHSSIKTTSDEGHSSALRSGIKEVLHEPLGRGPGTAGPASVYNNHPARISENYYVQIGQETGWLGLILFVSISFAVAYLLWLRRRSTLHLTLFASFVGLFIVNMLSHAWADESLCFLWWGLAGVSIATPAKKAKV